MATKGFEKPSIKPELFFKSSVEREDEISKIFKYNKGSLTNSEDVRYMSQIRTRIAPSPTGDPHVGTAYIALFNKCFARHNQGRFILRIEDTDQDRSNKKSENDILKALAWMGLDWDEGPDKGGEFGPYRQSERGTIYSAHINSLIERKKAFRCFCTKERLAEVREKQIKNKDPIGYDGQCLNLSEEEISKNLEQGLQYVIRMVVPEEGECRFEDGLRGEVCINWSQIDMQVLIKSDGLPTYHFANVVDDHLMNITHVIRGEEWINSVPKHLLLYEYFDWEPPAFFHMPLLRNPDKSKLSKRKNPTSIHYYRDAGYQPQALLNYLGMMGWSMPDSREKFSFEEMVSEFDIQRVSLGGPVFDVEKLDWLNGKYLREDLSDQEFWDQFTDWSFCPKRIGKIVPLLRDRVEKFSDVIPLAGFLFGDPPVITQENFNHGSLSSDECLEILQLSIWELEKIRDWQRECVESSLMLLAKKIGLKPREFLFPLFVSRTGKPASTSVIEAITILGLDLCRARVRNSIMILGGLSKKSEKALAKKHKGLCG